MVPAITAISAVGASNLLSTGAVFGVNYLLARYRVGAVSYQAYDKLTKYRAAAANVINKWLDPNKRKPIEVTRVDENTHDASTFHFKNVSILDFAAIDKQIEQSIEQEIEKTIENQATRSLPASSSTSNTIQYFNVTLQVPNSVKLGEIDYSDWEQRADFEITITRQSPGGQTTLAKDSEEYQQVLATLKKFAKVTANEQLTPNDDIKRFSATSGSGALGTFIDFVKSTKLGGSQINRQAVDTTANLNEHLLDDAYMDGLQQVAIARAREKDYSILNNYLGVIEQAQKNELITTQKLRKKLQARVLAYDIKSNNKKLWLLAGITAALVIAGIVGLVVLNIYAPGIGMAITTPIVGLFTAAAGVIAARFFNISGGLLGLSAISLAVTIWLKSKKEWQKTKMDTLKAELDECKEAEKQCYENIENIREMKNSAQKTLQAIVSFEESQEKTLNLSGNTPKDIARRIIRGSLGKFSKFFTGLSENRIGNIGMNIICHHLINSRNLINCEILNLANNGITREGANFLANALEKAQIQYPDLKLHEINLSGNPIGADGLAILQEALAKNFTVTVLQYDKQYTNSETNRAINQQLLINKYLQGTIAAGDPAVINLFGSMDNLIECAQEKVKSNHNIVTVPIHISNDAAIADIFSNVVKQNKIFPTLYQALNLAQHLIEACNLDPKRCTAFIERENESSKNKIEVKGLYTTIANDVSPLRSLTSEASCIAFLQLIVPKPEGQPHLDLTQNFIMFAAILATVPKKEDNSTDAFITGMLQEAFKHLGTDHKSFKEILETQRQQIAVNDKIDDEQQRQATLTILDSMLHPELAGPNSAAFKTYQLQQLVIAHPEKNPRQTFEQLINFYKEIPSEQAAKVFAISHPQNPENSPNQTDFDQKLNQLMSSIKLDEPTFPSFIHTQLSRENLSEQHRQAFLGYYFKLNNQGDEAYDQEASLVARIIAEIDNATLLQSADSQLLLADSFANTHNYETLKNILNKQLRNAKRSDAKSDIQEKLEKIIQENLAAELQQQYAACLGATVTGNILEDFERLKLRLKNDDLLRSSASFSNLVPAVQIYIDHIITRNQLHDALTNYSTSQIQLEKFLEIYTKITDEKERQSCLADLLAIEGNAIKLQELLKDDIKSPPNCAQLSKLTNEQRAELLAAGLENEQYAQGIAMLVAMLINMKDSLSQEYIWRIFDWKTYHRWSFQDYIKNLKTLRDELKDSDPITKKQIDSVIQAGLQEDLLARFSHLRGEKDSRISEQVTFNRLTEELKENYDLIDITGLNFIVQSPVDEKIQNLINFTAKRNLLRKHLIEADLENFITAYTNFNIDDCDKALEAIDKLKILQLIDQDDLGLNAEHLSCEKLRQLESEHKIKLLTHCFSLNDSPEDAHKKAVLISGLLTIPDLFQRTDKTSQAIKTEIYWAITPKGYYTIKTGVPYYKLSASQQRLQAILSGIPPTDVVLESIRTGLKQALDNNSTAQQNTVTILPTLAEQVSESTSYQQERKQIIQEPIIDQQLPENTIILSPAPAQQETL